MSHPISDPLLYRAAAVGIPASGTFELTRRCNLACRMCYLRGRKRCADQPTAAWRSLIDEAAAQGTLFLMLTGGEPLLHSGFRDIYLHAQERGLIVSLNTNGIQIDEDWADFFQKHPPRRMNLTLYGMSAETYRDLCGDESAFEKTLRAIDLLQGRGVPLKINGTLTRRNAAEYPQMLDYLQQRGLYFHADAYLFPNAEAGFDDVRLSAPDCGQYLWQTSLTRAGKEERALLAQELLTQPERASGDPSEGESRCMAGRNSYTVTADFRMKPCTLFPDGEITLSGGFLAAWERCRQWVDSLRLCADCTTCPKRPLCHVCGAALYAETHSFTKRPNYLCQCTESFIRALAQEQPLRK